MGLLPHPLGEITHAVRQDPHCSVRGSILASFVIEITRTGQCGNPQQPLAEMSVMPHSADFSRNANLISND